MAVAICKPGLRKLAQRLAAHHMPTEKELENAVTQLFPNSADKKEDDVRLLMEKYMMYKENYMKHLQFDSKLENLSKFSIFAPHLTATFSLSWRDRTRPTRDGVHPV